MQLKMNNENNVEGNHAVAEDEDLFYFESDHLALRGNVDYSEVLKTMFVLEAQRARALQDYHKVEELKQFYLNDPLVYIEQCENGTLDIPHIQSIAEIPKINWSKYATNVPENYLRQLHSTRAQAVKKEVEPEKNSKSWTPEEQRKLEELLVKYPPEEVDRKRIIKIANELGTRTRAQVASRLQKYFVKLMKAGLPIPGRFPKSGRKKLDRKHSLKSQSHYHRKYLKSSTFFPDTIIPVVMDDTTPAPGPSTSSVNSSAPKEELSQSNYLLANNYLMEKKPKVKASPLDIEAELLKWVKAEKMLESNASLHQHYGYRCDYCDDDPIQGSRWHCTTCVTDSVDYCTDCMLSQFYSDNAHDLQHKFLLIRNEKEVTNGFWSESDSESDSKSNDESDSDDDSHGYLSSLSDSIHNENIDKVSEECPNDIFEVNHVNGDEVA